MALCSPILSFLSYVSILVADWGRKKTGQTNRCRVVWCVIVCKMEKYLACYLSISVIRMNVAASALTSSIHRKRKNISSRADVSFTYKLCKSPEYLEDSFRSRFRFSISKVLSSDPVKTVKLDANDISNERIIGSEIPTYNHHTQSLLWWELCSYSAQLLPSTAIYLIFLLFYLIFFFFQAHVLCFIQCTCRAMLMFAPTFCPSSCSGKCFPFFAIFASQLSFILLTWFLHAPDSGCHLMTSWIAQMLRIRFYPTKWCALSSSFPLILVRVWWLLFHWHKSL